LNKQKLYWLLQISGWLTFALVQIIGFKIFGTQEVSSNQITFWFVEAGLFLFFTHIFRNIIVNWGWLAISIAKLIPRVILAIVVLALFVYFSRLLVSVPLGMYNPKIALSAANVIGLSVIYAVIFMFWVILYFIYHYFEQYNISLKHEAARHEIELSNLKAQLNPHFIFNALNSIRALVDENPRKSKNSITQLSNILRSSLVSDKKRLTLFENELKTVKDYLGLESIRYEERLKTEYDIHPESFQYYVPPLMLQTLVENGVKHGISKLKHGGIIRLKTYIESQELKIVIENSGTYNINGSLAEGLGLKNTKKRLSLLFGENASFEIENTDHKTVITKLTIPKSNTYESTYN